MPNLTSLHSLAYSTYSPACTTARNDLGVVYSSLDGTQLAVVDGVCVRACVCMRARALCAIERRQCLCVHMCTDVYVV